MLSVGSEYRTSFIKKIFDLDDNKAFKNKAQRYQHIIRFFLADESRSFKITDIQKEVLNEPSEVFNVDKSLNPSQIRVNYNPQFNKYLHELEDWKLLTSNPAKGRGGTDTREYQLSKRGKTFALMIEYIHSKNKQDVYNKLFVDWKSYFTEFSTSLDLFCLKYLDKCKELRLFDEFADFFIHSSIYDNQHIRNPADLFTQMTLVKVDDEQKNKILLRLWLESLYELDDSAMVLFLNHIRIHIHRAMENRVEEFSKYELKRYEKRNMHNNVIAEFQCSVCNFPQYNEIPVVLYIMRIFIKEDAQIDNLISRLKCENCGENELALKPLI